MIDEILSELEESIKNKLPLSHTDWIEKAKMLVVLQGDETDKLYSLQQQCAQEKVIWLEKGRSVAESKLRVEASDAYKEMLRQKAKVERIEEIIRIAKLQSRLKNEEMGGYNL